MSSPYVLIVGHGRSGTTWLLELLDRHERTRCRNEPNALAGSAFARLPDPWLPVPCPDAIGSAWDAAVASASSSAGFRDRPRGAHKRYLGRLARRLGRIELLDLTQLQRRLRTRAPALAREEWPMPWWVVDRREFTAALPVLKLNQVPGWAAWALERRPQARVLHIVRHPGGYLRSWRRRYVPLLGAERVLRDNAERLRRVAAACPAWGARFGPVERMSLEESELWFWRYTTESIDEAGRASPSYRRMLYEELARDTVEVARGLYALCGLEWSTRVEAAVVRHSEGAPAIAAAWRERASPEDLAAIERVLDGSPLAAWWSAPEGAQLGALRRASEVRGPAARTHAG